MVPGHQGQVQQFVGSGEVTVSDQIKDGLTSWVKVAMSSKPNMAPDPLMVCMARKTRLMTSEFLGSSSAPAARTPIRQEFVRFFLECLPVQFFAGHA